MPLVSPYYLSYAGLEKYLSLPIERYASVNSTLDTSLREMEKGILIQAGEGDAAGALSLFQMMILSFYEKNGRDLPWRRTTDPYHILVSEIMLQQTQVERVSPKYLAFIEEFPTIGSLAAAPLSDLLAAWAGLGYNRRAINLQKAAIILRDEHNCSVPPDPDLLATLPGIGKATAAAICVYAFNMPLCYIETNIRRIFIHYFFQGEENIPDTAIMPLIEAALYHENPGKWYSGLMDYGSILKRRMANPNQRSRHYTRQAPFAGSDRKIRGEILRLLLKEKAIGRKKLKSALIGEERDEWARLERLLSDLTKEGFVREDDGIYSIRE